MVTKRVNKGDVAKIPNEPNKRLIQAIIGFWEKEERPPTYHELGISLGLDQAGIFRQVKRLRDLGVLKQTKAIVPMSICISFDDRKILERAGLV